MLDAARRPAGSRLLAGVAIVLGSAGLASAVGEGAPARFSKASVSFEQNATDGDVEVVFKVTGRREGLSKLSVVSPDGRKVIDFAAPDASTLGLREFVFESPEPKDVKGLKAAYPAGVYKFAATTASGQELRGESTLSHELPPPTSILGPGAKAHDVPVSGLQIRWSPVANASGYVVELEQDKLDAHLEVSLPGSATTFSVPDGFLVPGREYDLGVGTVSKDGNVSFVETSFTTAAK